MKILVGCEYSGRVREALRKLGHDAWSCDLLPSEDNSPFHLQMDVFEAIEKYGPWDMAVFHPECTHLAVSGVRWLTDHWVHRKVKKNPLPHTLEFCQKNCRWHDGTKKRAQQVLALAFVKRLWAAPIPKVVIENPVSQLSSLWQKPTQTIQPYWFGHPEFKRTCLWSRGLPRLVATNLLKVPEKGTQEYKDWEVVHRMPPGPLRWKDRSRTYQGIADAIAFQLAGPAK